VTTIRVPSGAMQPSLALGQHVEVDENAYRSVPPAIGDVVLFFGPLNVDPEQSRDAVAGAACAVPRPGPGSECYIKRVVAGAGDVVSIARGFVVRNGTMESSDQVKAGDDRLDTDFPTPIVIPPGTRYLLGDNRAQSMDSRWWGPIPDAWIIGKLDLSASAAAHERELRVPRSKLSVRG
jgi:signal peptidase I